MTASIPRPLYKYRHIDTPLCLFFFSSSLYDNTTNAQLYKRLYKFTKFSMAEGNDEHTSNSPIYEEGKILIKDLIRYKQGQNLSPVNATGKTLRKISDDIEKRNPELLAQMCSKLNFSKETIYSSFCGVAKEMFSDGVINWGRIVVLFAFSAQVVKYCDGQNICDQVDNITDWTARFVNEMGWIEQQGGWSAINRHFRDFGRDNNSSWWCQWWSDNFT